MNNTLKIIAIAGAFGLAGYFGYKLSVKAKIAYEEAKEKREEEEAELLEKKEAFAKDKKKFKTCASERRIAKVTLENQKINTSSNRSYLYDKLKSYKSKVLDCDFYDMSNYEYFKESFDNLYDMLENGETTSEAIDAKIISLKAADTERDERIERNRKQNEAVIAHKREMEKIEAENKAQLDIYRAKLEAEKAKLETICETMNGDNKNVNHTLNIKTNISEDN